MSKSPRNKTIPWLMPRLAFSIGSRYENDQLEDRNVVVDQTINGDAFKVLTPPARPAGRPGNC